jgi:hypothetical protein
LPQFGRAVFRGGDGGIVGVGWELEEDLGDAKLCAVEVAAMLLEVFSRGFPASGFFSK